MVTERLHRARLGPGEGVFVLIDMDVINVPEKGEI